MANSLAIQGSLQFQAPSGSQYVNESVNLGFPGSAPAGQGYLKTIYNATTTETTVNTAQVPALGYIFVRNTDNVNFVQIGSATGAYTVNLAAGDVSLVKWNSNSIFIKSNTANVAVQICAFSS